MDFVSLAGMVVAFSGALLYDYDKSGFVVAVVVVKMIKVVMY